MNKKILFLVMFSLFSITARASDKCDFTKIKSNMDGTYIYSKELHICVGEMKQNLDSLNKESDDTKKIIQLKDLALTKTEERVNLWIDTSGKLEDRINKVQSLESTNYLIYFGLGILTTFAAAYVANQTFHK